MTRYIEGWDRRQRLLMPDSVDDFVGADSPVRVVDAFIDELNLDALEQNLITPAHTRSR